MKSIKIKVIAILLVVFAVTNTSGCDFCNCYLGLNPATNKNFQTIYADDITQVIITKNKHHYQLQKEIKRINDFENKWKIQTCIKKFSIIPILKKKFTYGFNTSANGKMLGLKISTRGYGTHITDAINKAKYQLGKLFNLRNLHPNQKRTIYNMTIRPI